MKNIFIKKISFTKNLEMTQKIINLDRCMNKGCRLKNTQICEICELGWCSKKCKKCDQEHFLVCAPKYPDEETKKMLMKSLGMMDENQLKIGEQKYKVFPGPIKGQIPNFVIDRTREPYVFDLWYSKLDNKIPKKAPTKWCYVCEFERTIQLCCIFFTVEQRSEIEEMMKKQLDEK